MSLLKKKKGQIVRLGQEYCDATVDNNEILFVRVEDVVSGDDARFEVPYTHNAVVIKGGGDMRYYKSGTYDIFEDKKEAKQWKNGISVLVIYIPKETRVPIKWGTPEKLLYRDEASNKVITVGARGECDISVINPEQFYRKVVGIKKEFNISEFKKRFVQTISSEFTHNFLNIVKEKKLTYDQFDIERKEIAARMEEILNSEFKSEWGVIVLHFIIYKFELEDADKEAIEEFAAEKQKQEKLKEYLAELERLDDKQWEREKYLRNLELQDKAAYYEVLKVIGNRPALKDQNEFKCPNCGAAYKPADKFCPRCGKHLSKEPVKCPECGHFNECDADFCANCGKKLK